MLNRGTAIAEEPSEPTKPAIRERRPLADFVGAMT